MKRILRRGFIALLSLVVISITVLIIWVSPLLHITDGEVSIPELKAAVEVVRDEHGVPHIKAKNILDAYTVLGFIHARDRIWQMEITRRLGAGRLAEIVGNPGVRSDMMMRTLGLERLAKLQFTKLDETVQTALIAYARGVNTWLKHHRGALSPEFTLLGFQPEDWRPVDSLLWGKLMGLRLTRNWRREIQRYRLLQRISLEKMRDLWPDFPANDPVSIQTSSHRENDILEQSFAYLDQLIGPFSNASNAWVIAGQHTKSGKPILANDPHLGYSIPILWYLARVETPGHQIIGATVPGLPFHILGQNNEIAWGLTTTSGDTADLFIEKIDPTNSKRYITPTGVMPFQTRNESIHVNNGEMVSLTVRETRHGPVVSDLIFGANNNSETVLAFQATFLNKNDQTPDAIYHLNQAQDWQSFLSAINNFHAPQQNVLYADRSGNIGMIAAGRMPIRRQGQGWLPQAGWTGDNDWKKFIPFKELPITFNPPAGIIVNANNRVIDKKYAYYFSDDFAPGYRAKRITDVLTSTENHTPESSAQLQMDEVSIMAQEILPLMLEKVSEHSLSSQLKTVITKLKAWQGKMDVNLSEPLIFNAWLRELIRNLAEDDLGEYFKRYWYVKAHFVRLVLTEKNHWCDDIRTKDNVETCEKAVTKSLERAIEHLKRRFGEQIDQWRWGHAHRVEFDHMIFSKIPLINSLFDISVETGGGQFTPNKGAYRYREDDRLFENRHGPGYRAVYDLADSAKSRFMIATGQSGHPLSSNYDNFIEKWKLGKSIFLDIPKKILEKSNQGIIRFTP